MTDAAKPYLELVGFCESLLDQYGPDSPSGVGWFRGDANARYRTMLEVVRPGPGPVTLLDFGCGSSHLYDFIGRQGRGDVSYSGLDLSPRFLELSRAKYPAVTYYDVDVLDPAAPPLPVFDYVVMNGIFTYKGTHSHAAMFDYLRTLVPRVFEIASIGIAFNVMSAQVEWTRDDLFHLPVDELLDFLSTDVSRHVVIRHDYGLYEYTAYVYRLPSDPDQHGARHRLRGRGLRPEA